VFRSLKCRQKLFCHSVVWGEIITSDKLQFAIYEFRTFEIQFQASHSLQPEHIEECSCIPKLYLCANIHGSQFKETTEPLCRVQRNPELPLNHICQNHCATCLVKEDHPSRNSELAATFVLIISSSECIPCKNALDLKDEIICGQELVKKIYVKLLVYLQLMSGQM